MSAEQRARLAAQRAAETDPVQREAYALAARAGFDWYDTESSARRMAEHAAAELVALLKALDEINKTIYAIGAPLGSDEYFKIRGICCDSVKSQGNHGNERLPDRP